MSDLASFLETAELGALSWREPAFSPGPGARCWLMCADTSSSEVLNLPRLLGLRWQRYQNQRDLLSVDYVGGPHHGATDLLTLDDVRRQLQAEQVLACRIDRYDFPVRAVLHPHHVVLELDLLDGTSFLDLHRRVVRRLLPSAVRNAEDDPLVIGFTAALGEPNVDEPLVDALSRFDQLLVTREMAPAGVVGVEVDTFEDVLHQHSSVSA